MLWQSEMTTLLRVLIDDLSPTPNYSDGRLIQTLAVAAQIVIHDISFFNKHFEVDIQAMSITPDPADRDGQNRDDSFINLVCFKAACVIERSEARTSVRQGIAIRDGSSSIDLRGSMDGRLKLIEKGWCSVYDDSKLNYESGRSGAVCGAAIVGAFRVFAGYSVSAFYPNNQGGNSYFR